MRVVFRSTFNFLILLYTPNIIGVNDFSLGLMPKFLTVQASTLTILGPVYGEIFSKRTFRSYLHAPYDAGFKNCNVKHKGLELYNLYQQTGEVL